MDTFFPPPVNEQQLLFRANCLAGCMLGDLAKHLHINVPNDLRRDKGWVGQLIEYFLGATAGSQAERDFPQLRIELKTIPVNRLGKPLETTFVCVAPLLENTGVTWETSHVRYKLQRVLWVPIEGERQIPLAHRRIGYPVLWSPDWRQELQLKSDWEELMDFIVLGKIEKLTARSGAVLQIRPKAANGQALAPAIGERGFRILTRPRGFYLKKAFTHHILQNYSHSAITQSHSDDK